MIRESRSRVPVSGAQIVAIDSADVSHERVTVLTDARGAYSFPSVSKSAGLLVRRDGFKPGWRVVAEADASGTMDIDILADAKTASPGAELQSFEGVGMVLDGAHRPHPGGGGERRQPGGARGRAPGRRRLASTARPRACPSRPWCSAFAAPRARRWPSSSSGPGSRSSWSSGGACCTSDRRPHDPVRRLAACPAATASARVLVTRAAAARRAPAPACRRAGGVSGAGSRRGSAGRRITKVVPSPTRLCTEIDPPWFFTMRWQMARPSPVPFCLVVKKGTKMFSCWSGSNARPVVADVELHLLGRAEVAEALRPQRRHGDARRPCRRGPGTAFCTRLMSTCLSCSASPSTRGRRLASSAFERRSASACRSGSAAACG